MQLTGCLGDLLFGQQARPLRNELLKLQNTTDIPIVPYWVRLDYLTF